MFGECTHDRAWRDNFCLSVSPSEYWKLNLGLQAWWQAPLPTEPACLPSGPYLYSLTGETFFPSCLFQMLPPHLWCSFNTIHLWGSFPLFSFYFFSFHWFFSWCSLSFLNLCYGSDGSLGDGLIIIAPNIFLSLFLYFLLLVTVGIPYKCCPLWLSYSCSH